MAVHLEPSAGGLGRTTPRGDVVVITYSEVEEYLAKVMLRYLSYSLK